MRVETRHALVLILGTAVTAALAVAYAVFAGRRLGPEGSADFFGALALIALCQVAMGPINGTVARFSAQYAERGAPGRIRTLAREVTQRVALAGGLGLMGALLLLQPITKALRFSGAAPVWLAFVIVYLTLVLSVGRGVMRGLQRFGSLNWNTILEAGARLVLGVALLLWVCNAGLAVSAYLGGVAAALLMATVQLRRSLGGHAAQPLDGGEVRRFVGPMLVLMLTSAAYQNADMLLVKRFFGPVEAGLYGAAFTLSSRAIGALVTPFNVLLLPLLTALHTRGAGGGAALRRVIGLFAGCAAAPVLLFCVAPDAVMDLLYGEAFGGAARWLPSLTGVRLLSYGCHFMALSGAAANDFRLLRVYVPVLVLQVLGMLLWHATPSMILIVAGVAQAVALTAMVATAFRVGAARQGK